MTYNANPKAPEQSMQQRPRLRHGPPVLLNVEDPESSPLQQAAELDPGPLHGTSEGDHLHVKHILQPLALPVQDRVSDMQPPSSASEEVTSRIGLKIPRQSSTTQSRVVNAKRRFCFLICGPKESWNVNVTIGFHSGALPLQNWGTHDQEATREGGYA